MIVFELSMPNRGSWNGKWSGDGSVFVRVKKECDVMKEVWDKDFWYYWNDGWTACVSVKRMPVAEARKLNKKSRGFCGYDWMINSIIKNGEIKYERRTS